MLMIILNLYSKIQKKNLWVVNVCLRLEGVIQGQALAGEGHKNIGMYLFLDA